MMVFSELTPFLLCVTENHVNFWKLGNGDQKTLSIRNEPQPNQMISGRGKDGMTEIDAKDL